MQNKKRKELRPIRRHYCLTITTPNRDLHRVAPQMLDPHTSYQVIPSTPSSLLYDVQKYIESMLPYSKETLLDVCVPMVICNQDGIASRHLTRYLLLSGKIIGIKVCTGANWPRFFCREHKVHFLGRSINVPIGQFLVQFKHFKLGLFFESQLQNDDNILSEYYRHGCQIYSVIKNTQTMLKNPKPSMYYIDQVSVRNKLQSFAEQKQIIMMYCGCQLATSCSQVYLTGSMIMQGTSILYKNGLQLFSNNNYITMLGNINLVKSCKIYQSSHHSIAHTHLQHVLMEDQPIIINTLNTLQLATLKSVINIPKCPNTVDVNTIRKMYLWYLYHNVNCRSQFMFSIPLTAKSQNTLNLLREIAQNSNKQIGELVGLFKRQKVSYVPFDDSITVIQQIDKTIKSNEYLYRIDQDRRFYIYSDTLQENIYFRRQLKQHSNIIECGHLIPEWCRMQTQQQGVDEVQMQRYAEELLKRRVTSNSLVSMLVELDKHNCTARQKYHIIKDIVPRKMKEKIKINRIYLFLINADQREIEESIVQAEKQIININQPHQTTKNAQSKYKEKLIKLKKYKDRQKDCLKCHKCGLLFDKNQGYRCFKCSKNTCLQCCDKMGYIQQATVTYEVQYNCVCCLGYCNCKQCRNKNFLSNQNQQNEEEPSNMMILENFAIQTQNPFTSKYDCNRCYIEGRTIKNILIQCNNCYEENCYGCVSAAAKIIGAKLDNWICSKCSDIILHERMERENTLLRQEDKKTEIFEEEKVQEKANLWGKKYQEEENKRNRKQQPVIQQQIEPKKYTQPNNNYKGKKDKRNKQSLSFKGQRLQRKEGNAWWVPNQGKTDLTNNKPRSNSPSSSTSQKYNKKNLWTMGQSDKSELAEERHRVSWKRGDNAMKGTFEHPRARFSAQKTPQFQRQNRGRIIVPNENVQLQEQIDY